MKRTKEERFLVALYKAEKTSDRYVIGKEAGLNAHAIDMIVRDLCQINFIKKDGPCAVIITDHGKNLAYSLLNE